MWYLIVYDDSCYTICNDKEELKRQVENLAHDGFFEKKHYDIYQIKKVENTDLILFFTQSPKTVCPKPNCFKQKTNKSPC